MITERNKGAGECVPFAETDMFPAPFAMSYGSEVRILTKSGLQNDYNDEVPWKER